MRQVMEIDDTPEADWKAAGAEPDYVLPLPGNVSMRFRRIPKGSFRMGSRGHSPTEEPIHRVVIPYDFWLGRSVVTREQIKCMPINDAFLAISAGDPMRPAVHLSWEDARRWCKNLSEWDGLPAEVRELRLPYEAEWEYACRAGTETDFYNGNGEPALAEIGWYCGNSGFRLHATDEPVARTEAHPARLVGMHGNVWEWCEDVWDGQAYRKMPPMWESGRWSEHEAGAEAFKPISASDHIAIPKRVLRGGSWSLTAEDCRSARRFGWRCDVGDADFGFRVCLVLSPPNAAA